jgi:hypothetical protein
MSYVIKEPTGMFIASAYDRRTRKVEKVSLATHFKNPLDATDYATQKQKRDRTGGTWSVWNTEKLCLVFSVTGRPAKFNQEPK